MDEVEVESTLLADGSSSSRLKRIGSLRKQPYFTNLRLQLQEQFKCFDSRVETQVVLTNELQDYFRKKAEIELEYSRNLDKLTKSLLLRQKELKQRREQLHLFSLYNCWQELINETKKESQEHGVLAEIYNSHITTRLSMVMDDLQRIYKQCHEIGTDSHEELLKVLHELHTSTKTYHLYQTEHKTTESKLRLVESQKKKLELIIPKEKIEKSKKIRLVDKEIQKRRNKYTDARFKALKAKNEYVLCMDAANAAVQKYFVDDLSDLIDCMDLGFYQCVSRALNMYISTQDHVKNSIGTNMGVLSKYILSLDSRLDKQKFLEANNSVFIMPKKVEFQSLKGDEIDPNDCNSELETIGFIRQELEQRLIQLHRRLDSLRIEADESWKTLETAETSLLQLLTVNDYSADEYFLESSHRSSKPDYLLTTQRLRAETDEFHLSKFRDYMLGTNRIARLQAKYDHIRKVMGDLDPNNLSPGLAQTLAEPRKIVRRKRIGHFQNNRNPRLFGGSLEEYIEFTNQEIPIVLKSCIRVINLYGLHHQGIFRVSGSQIEINNFKDAFERGEDPLIDINDASDINSIAGVLKLYLRELREPLFPIVYFEQFMELAQLESKHLFVTKIRDLIRSLPRPVYIVLRYLFAFLNHLSEYSDENMMDPYNIAICFGPTLVPVPEDKDQVQYQNLVNELIKNVIVYMEDIFLGDEDYGGIRYEKYISKEPDEVDVDTPGDNPHEDLESETLCPSEDDSVFLKERDISLHVFQKSEYLEGIAQYDFKARSDREISFKKGDSITLYSQVSNDWWKGSCNGINGLVPDKYIMLKIRDEEQRERLLSSPFLFEKKQSHPSHHHSRTASDSYLTTRSLPSPGSSLVPAKLHLASSGDSMTSSNSNESKSGAAENVAKNTTTSPLIERSMSVPEGTNGEKDRTSRDTSPFSTKLVIGNVTEVHQVITKTQLDESIETKIMDDELGDCAEGFISVTTSEPKSAENEGGAFPSPPSGNDLHGLIQPANSSTPKVKVASAFSAVTPNANKPKVQSNIQFWESKAKFSSPAATPDLVMDLPMMSPTSHHQVDEALESPDSSSETAAECFAKQNQSTLKKNYKNPLSKDNEQPSTSAPKPQVKVKPIVLKKPSVPIHLLSTGGGGGAEGEKEFRNKRNYDDDESSKNISDDEKTTNL